MEIGPSDIMILVLNFLTCMTAITIQNNKRIVAQEIQLNRYDDILDTTLQAAVCLMREVKEHAVPARDDTEGARGN